MISTTAPLYQVPCPWCGGYHGGICPTVRAIEYHADGITVKRVEFHAPAPLVFAHPTCSASDMPIAFDDMPRG